MSASSDTDDYPRSLRDPAVRERRRAMLDQPHVRALTAFAAELRRCGPVEVPDFDPLDGGIGAEVLFLFEKPGPMTAATGRKSRIGSGFISRNNDDPSAEATFHFMREAGIPRTRTVTWNLIPWWNGTRAITRDERHDGVASTQDLIGRLPKVQAVVLVGKTAALARRDLEATGLAVFQSDHPSPLVRASWPARWRAIPSAWAQVNAVLR